MYPEILTETLEGPFAKPGIIVIYSAFKNIHNIGYKGIKKSDLIWFLYHKVSKI